MRVVRAARNLLLAPFRHGLICIGKNGVKLAVALNKRQAETETQILLRSSME